MSPKGCNLGHPFLSLLSRAFCPTPACRAGHQGPDQGSLRSREAGLGVRVAARGPAPQHTSSQYRPLRIVYCVRIRVCYVSGYNRICLKSIMMARAFAPFPRSTGVAPAKFGLQ